jgi:hypothetical protein
MKQKLLPWIIALAAISISVSAAFYSITGLSKLFAGASTEVIIMASSLEFAKLVIASLLYQYWGKLNKLLKIYLSIACVILILITSAGIYGFLSSAYQQTAMLEGNISSQIELLDRKKTNYQDQLSVYTEEKTNINTSITSLREGLSNNIVQYTNSEGQVITTTSSATRQSLERQLDQALERQTEVNAKIEELNQYIFDLDSKIVEVQTSSETSSELGPLKYISGLMGIEMDKVVNYLLLIIVFVFDPLAISLVLAANFAFEQIKPKVKQIEITPTIRK